MKKKRAVELLVDLGLAETPLKAQALIMAGVVLTGTKRIDKAGQMLDPTADLHLKGKEHCWVSRGGLKLVKGLEVSNVDPHDFVCLDIGSSTGGFTDVLLTKKARKVYAVDVGYGLLAQKLRQDPRVILLERTNARHLAIEQIPEPIDLLVCDASFIGLRTVLPTPMSFVKPKGIMIALIKPQFEVAKHLIGEKGVVSDPIVHQDVCAMIADWVKAQEGWNVQTITPSPITGIQGNIEFLIMADKL